MRLKISLFAFRAAGAFMRARSLFAGVLVLLFAFFAIAAPAIAQTDIVLNPTGAYIDVQRGVAWGSAFNRTYVLTPQNPQTSLCLYVVNNNPTSSHSFSLAMFQSADPRVADYSNNTGRYAAVTVVGSPSPIAANTMGSAFGQTNAAARVAFVLSASSTQTGSPDTADIFVVQTTSGLCGAASGAQPVQGAALVGATTGLGNPILIGAPDPATSAVRFLTSSPGGGLNIGNVGVGSGSTYGQVTSPNSNANNGPLEVANFAQIGAGGVLAVLTEQAAQNSASHPQGLFVARSGYVKRITGTGVTSTTTFPLWNDSNGSADPTQNGMFESCRLDVAVTSFSGTAPTLDVYLQDGYNDAAFTDRIHLAQFTGVATAWASTNPAASTTSKAYTDATLAASTNVDGAIGPFGRIKFVPGGTAPNFGVNWTVSCR